MHREHILQMLTLSIITFECEADSLLIVFAMNLCIHQGLVFPKAI